jgi:ATP-binding cassette, subfamily B, bacterial
MGFIMDGIAAEKYDRTYTDRQLLRRIGKYFRPYLGLMVFVAVLIFLGAALDALLPILVSRGIDRLAGNVGAGVELWRQTSCRVRTSQRCL